MTPVSMVMRYSMAAVATKGALLYCRTNLGHFEQSLGAFVPIPQYAVFVAVARHAYHLFGTVKPTPIQVLVGGL